MTKKKEVVLNVDDLTGYYQTHNIVGILFGSIIAFTILITSIVNIVDYFWEIMLLLSTTILITEIASYFVLRHFKKEYHTITKTTFGASIIIKLLGIVFGFLGSIALGIILYLIDLIIDYISINPRTVLMYFLGSMFVILIFIVVMKINHEWYNNYLKRGK